jgi:tetratricopeptide (TPR) repeat protein
MGRSDEARREIEKAHELSPLSLVINTMVGFIDFYGRRYDNAILQYKKTIAMDPNFQMAYRYLLEAYFYKGMYKESLETLEKWKEIGNPIERLFIREKMRIYLHMGRIKEASQLYEQIESDLLDSNKARYHFVLGDIDRGFFFLEKALEIRDPNIRFIKIFPEFDNVRNDPRYKEILRKMNLE